MDAVKNFAYSTIATAPSPAASGTSLVVQAGDGAKFPAVSFNAVVWPAGTLPLSTNAEVVRVTVVSTDTFTITRAQEGSSARTIVVGDQIAAAITAKTLTDLNALPTVQTTTSTGSQNDFAATAARNLVLRANNATTLTLTGIAPGSDGDTLLLVAIGAGTVVLNNQDAGSSVADRIITGTGAALTLAATVGWAALVYDGTTARWRVVGSSVAAAASTVGTSTITTTGTSTSLALPSGTGTLIIFANNATLLTLQGIAAGTDGQRLTIFSIGAGQIDLSNQSGSASAVDRIITNVGNTISLAAGVGRVELIYDATATRWRVSEHEQVSPITPTFAAGTFTASGSMTWTVDSGDAVTFAYLLEGKLLTLVFTLDSTTVGGTLNTVLRIGLPNGFTVAKTGMLPLGYTSDNGVTRTGLIFCVAGEAFIRLYADNTLSTNWSAATNATTVRGTAVLEVA